MDTASLIRVCNSAVYKHLMIPTSYKFCLVDRQEEDRKIETKNISNNLMLNNTPGLQIAATIAICLYLLIFATIFIFL